MFDVSKGNSALLSGYLVDVMPPSSLEAEAVAMVRFLTRTDLHLTWIMAGNVGRPCITSSRLIFVHRI